MGQIVLGPSRAYPNTPTIGDSLESHTAALHSIAEALNIHERRTSDLLGSFVRVGELQTLGLINVDGDVITDVGSEEATTHHHDGTYLLLDGSNDPVTGLVVFTQGLNVSEDLQVANNKAINWLDSGASVVELLTLSSGESIPADDEWANVVLLAEFDGADDATSYTELSTNAAAAIFYNNAVLSTDQKKYGTASGYFSTHSDQIGFSYNADFYPKASTDHTIECWVYPTSIGALQVILGAGINTFNVGGWELRMNADGTVSFLTNKNGSNHATLNGSTALVQDQWSHVAIDWKSTGPTNATITLYINGTSDGSVGSGLDSYDNGGGWRTGYKPNDVSGTFVGYIDGIRVTKAQRYTGNFTPSTTAWPIGATQVISTGGFVVGDPGVTTTIDGSTITLSDPTTVDATLNVTGVATFDSYLELAPIAAPTYSDGLLFYDSTELLPGFYNDEADTIFHMGKDSVVRVRNSTGVTITKGQAVYINGATGNRPNVALARADAQATSRVAGVAKHDIENNTDGWIITLGAIAGLDTSSFSAGDELFLSTTTAGAYQNTKPTGANRAVVVGECTVSNPSVGEIEVQLRPTAAATQRDVIQNIEARWDFTDADGIRIYDSTEAYYVQFSHDSSDFNIAATNTTDLNITGITSVTRYDPTNDVTYSFTVNEAEAFLYIESDDPGLFSTYGLLLKNMNGVTLLDNSGIAQPNPPDNTGTYYVWDSIYDNDTDWNLLASYGFFNSVNFEWGNEIPEGQVSFFTTPSYWAGNNDYVENLWMDPHGGRNTKGVDDLGLTWLRDGTTLRIGADGATDLASETDWVEFWHDGTDFNIDATNTGMIDVTGAGVFRIAKEGQATTILQVGSETSVTGSVPNGSLDLFGESNGTVYSASLMVGSSNKISLLSPSSLGGSAVATFQYALNTTMQNATTFTLENGAGGSTQFRNVSATYFNTGFFSTANWYIQGLTGAMQLYSGADFWIRDGGALRIYDAGDTDYLSMSHDGTYFNISPTNTTQVRFNTGAVVAFENNDNYFTGSSTGARRIFLGPSSVTGSNGSDGILVMIGESSSILYGSAFRQSGTAVSLSGATDGAATAAATEFDVGLTTQVVGGNDLVVRDGGSLRLYDATDTDYIDASHDGTDLIVAGTNTTDLRFTGSFESIRIPDGTLASPGIAFEGEANTGFYLQTTGKMGMILLGTQGYTFTTVNLVTGSSYGPGFQRENASPTNPTLCPTVQGQGTGIGATGVDGSTLDLIVSGTNMVNMDTSVVAIGDGKSFRVVDALGTDYLNIAHDGTDVNITSANTTDINITDTDVRVTQDIYAANLHLTSTTTALEDITNAINTAARKVAGLVVFNTTTSKPVWSVGSADGSVWVDATGATAHTPI